MAEKVGKRKKRKFTPEAHARMVAAGASNLAGWRAKHDTRAIELEQEIAAFRTQMLAELGSNRSASRLALVEACVCTYASIQRLEHSIVYGPKKKLLDVTERISWMVSNQARLLKALNLGAKPKPRPFHELFPAKVPEKTTNPGVKADE